MESSKLKVGDVVRLKTHSPDMTVTRVGPYGAPDEEDYLLSTEVLASWFQDGLDLRQGIFGRDALQLISRDGDAP